ncbi:hypothetical protein ACWDWV_37270, partial [Streptosporangium sandarakinum]
GHHDRPDAGPGGPDGGRARPLPGEAPGLPPEMPGPRSSAAGDDTATLAVLPDISLTAPGPGVPGPETRR